MTKNPFLNSLAASIYIALVVLLINFLSKTEESQSFFVIPLMMISLFTLSAAMMAYIFCYQPLRMYLEGEKEKSIKLFLQTVGIFAGITLLMFAGYFLGIFS